MDLWIKEIVVKKMSDSEEKQDPFLKPKRKAWNKNLFLIDLAVKHFHQLANKVKQKT